VNNEIETKEEAVDELDIDPAKACDMGGEDCEACQ
jgi:hypothetical protein